IHSTTSHLQFGSTWDRSAPCFLGAGSAPCGGRTAPHIHSDREHFRSSPYSARERSLPVAVAEVPYFLIPPDARALPEEAWIRLSACVEAGKMRHPETFDGTGNRTNLKFSTDQ